MKSKHSHTLESNHIQTGSRLETRTWWTCIYHVSCTSVFRYMSNTDTSASSVFQCNIPIKSNAILGQAPL